MECKKIETSKSTNTYIIREEDDHKQFIIIDREGQQSFICSCRHMTLRVIESKDNEHILYINIIFDNRYIGMVPNASKIIIM